MTKHKSSDVYIHRLHQKFQSEPPQQPLPLEVATTNPLNGLISTHPHSQLPAQPHPPPPHRLPLHQKLLPTSTLLILLQLIRLPHRNLALQCPCLHMVGPTWLLPPPAPHEPPPARLHPYLLRLPTASPAPVPPLSRHRLRRRDIRRISRPASIYCFRYGNRSFARSARCREGAC